MSKKNVKPIQVLIEGFNLREVVKEDFLEALESKFEGEIKLVNLMFSIKEEENRRIIVLSHIRPIDEEKNTIVVDAPTSEGLNKIVNVIEEYGE